MFITGSSLSRAPLVGASLMRFHALRDVPASLQAKKRPLRGASVASFELLSYRL
jgi:hypothetical protein